MIYIYKQISSLFLCLIDAILIGPMLDWRVLVGGVSGAEVASAWAASALSFSWLSDRGRSTNSHRLSRLSQKGEWEVKYRQTKREQRNDENGVSGKKRPGFRGVRTRSCMIAMDTVTREHVSQMSCILTWCVTSDWMGDL